MGARTGKLAVACRCAWQMAPGRREMLAATPCHRDKRLVLGREMVTGREIAMLTGNLMIEALLQRGLRRGCHAAMWRAYAFGACSGRGRFQHGPVEMGMAGAGPLICTKSGGRDAVQGSRAGCREQTSRLNAGLCPFVQGRSGRRRRKEAASRRQKVGGFHVG